jgi:hypothetical protein
MGWLGRWFTTSVAEAAIREVEGLNSLDTIPENSVYMHVE